jgi:alkylation response protein AidB-like acyl-CoA dehydrogenase
MHFGLDDEQAELRASARAFLASASDARAVRRAMETERGWDPALFRRIADEMAWTALLVPESHGGLGLGWVELAALSGEIGRALTCAPFFSTVGLGLNALLAAGSEAQVAELSPAIAAGETTATLAFSGPAGRPGVAGVELHAKRSGSELVLDGGSSFVVDGHTASWIVVAARERGSCGDEGVSLALVPGESSSIQRRLLPTMDATRRLAEIRFESLRVPRERVLGEPGAAGPALAKVLARAAVVLAAEQVGGAEWCLDASVEYAKTRVQFGRPIGSFQAVKHRCADMLVAVETARAAMLWAARAASADDPDLAVAASTARAWCSDAFFRCAGDAIQIHGGIGFTWEHDAHLYFKRARSSAVLLGDAAWHREQIAARAVFPT